ncbi:MAG: fumarylacetoacetate hydrolase family protein [Candidatus Velthaea sp.]
MLTRFVRFGECGQERPGVLDAGSTVHDLSHCIADFAGEALSTESLARLAALDPSALSAAGAARIGPPVGRIGKIIGVGLNYRAHARELDKPVPAEPTLFLKATSSVCGPNDDLIMPPGAQRVDWEVELAVVIGRAGVNIGVADARSHIAGYCLAVDFSERDYQFNRGGYATKGKSSDTFGPLGPWLVPAACIADPQALTLELRVNGTVRQNGTTGDMIFSIDELIAYASEFMSLQPGDVILTGTPPGVGMGLRPPSYLQPGDCVEATIVKLGKQTHRVIVRSAISAALPTRASAI